MFRARNLVLFATCITATLLYSAMLRGSPSENPGRAALVDTNGLSPEQRGDLAGLFVRKWGGYVRASYGLDVRTWSARLVQPFAHGDADNIRHAFARTTYEGAMSELDGRGHRLSDEAVIDVLASTPSGPKAAPAAFGDLVGDLLFTPVQPCRIIDTRNTTQGAIESGQIRDFFVSGIEGYAFNGGSLSNCGLDSLGLKALALNVTVVYPSGAGHSILYNPGYPRPVAASINYPQGGIVSNSVIASVYPGMAGNPGKIAIFSQARSDYVVDVVGYFDVARATITQCTTEENSVRIPAHGADLLGVACPTGYGLTGGGAYWSNLSGGFETLINPGDIYHYPSPTNTFPENDRYAARGFNESDAETRMIVKARCCRVPGR